MFFIEAYFMTEEHELSQTLEVLAKDAYDRREKEKTNH